MATSAIDLEIFFVTLYFKKLILNSLYNYQKSDVCLRQLGINGQPCTCVTSDLFLNVNSINMLNYIFFFKLLTYLDVIFLLRPVNLSNRLLITYLKCVWY